MGWCSGTDHMDVAMEAAESLFDRILERARQLGNDAPESDWYDRDELLRPFVAAVAEKLRDAGWDCIEESDYFDRFEQEMLGNDDREHARWLAEQYNEAAQDENYERSALLLAKINAHNKKMEANT